MIRTKIIEAQQHGSTIKEVELGWCLLGEVPIEKGPPKGQKPGEPMPPPFVVKVNGANHFVIGHSWDINTKLPKKPDHVVGDAWMENQLAADQLPDAILVLIVQRIPEVASGLVAAPAGALKELERVMPPLGGANGRRVN